MLKQGGMKVSGEFPFQEDERLLSFATEQHKKDYLGALIREGKMPQEFIDDKVRLMSAEYPKGWIEEFEGGVLKILSIYNTPPPKEYDYKIIWLDRDFDQQAKSWRKYQINKLNLTVAKEVTKAHRKKLPIQRMLCLDAISHLIEGRPHVIKFEDLLKFPVDISEELAKYLDHVKLDTKAMAGCVLQRQTSCLNYMLEDGLQKLGKDWREVLEASNQNIG